MLISRVVSLINWMLKLLIFILGIIIFVIGISKLTKALKDYIRLIIVAAVMLGSLSILFFTDYLNVKLNNQAPMFRETTTYLGSDDFEILYYDAPLYNVIKCGDKYEIIKNKNYSQEEIIDYCYKNR